MDALSQKAANAIIRLFEDAPELKSEFAEVENWEKEEDKVNPEQT